MTTKTADVPVPTPEAGQVRTLRGRPPDEHDAGYEHEGDTEDVSEHRRERDRDRRREIPHEEVEPAEGLVHAVDAHGPSGEREADADCGAQDWDEAREHAASHRGGW